MKKLYKVTKIQLINLNLDIEVRLKNICKLILIFKNRIYLLVNSLVLKNLMKNYWIKKYIMKKN
jgi:hypothetical protein